MARGKSFLFFIKLKKSWRICGIFALLFIALLKLFSNKQEAVADKKEEPFPNKPLDLSKPFKAILLRAKGGLGNQLFQFACSYTLARKYHWPLLFEINQERINDHSISNSNEDRPFALQNFRIPVNNYTILDAERVPRDTKIVHLQDKVVLGQDSTVFHVQGNLSVLYSLSSKDYCQSSHFFATYQQELLHLLQPSKQFLEERSEKFILWEKRIRNFKTLEKKNVVSLHIRMGDFMRLGNLPHLSFYRKGIQQFQEILGRETLFLVFSDEIEKAKTFLSSLDSRYGDFLYLEGLSTAEDFFLMTKCDHALIGPSSFAFWAAFLIKNKDKVVIGAIPNLNRIWSPFYKTLYQYFYYPAEWRKISAQYD